MFRPTTLAMPLRQMRLAQPLLPATRAQVMQPGRLLQQSRTLRLQATPKRMGPVPNEEHSAHTISQRIRTLKKIPPELIPLGIVLGVAIFAAFYSLGRHLYADGTLRLYRSRGHNQAKSSADTRPKDN